MKLSKICPRESYSSQETIIKAQCCYFYHMSRLLPIIALILSAQFLWGQDPIFSQFNASPLALNPALTGTTYTPRIAAIYRNQWPSWDASAFVTYAISYDQYVPYLNSGFGVMFMSDDAGDGIWKKSSASLFYSYQIQASKKLFFKWGVKGTYVQDKLDWDKLKFGDQIFVPDGFYDSGGAMFTTEEERPASLTNGYFDVSTGIMAYTERVFGGLAIMHINTPDENILDVNNSVENGLPMRILAHMGMQFDLPYTILRNSTFISPSVMYSKQGDFQQFNAGAFAGMGVLHAGVWYRHTANSGAESIIFQLGAKYEMIRFGYAFDWTIATGLRGNTGGSHEISLVLNFDETEGHKKRRKSEAFNDCLKLFK